MLSKLVSEELVVNAELIDSRPAELPSRWIPIVQISLFGGFQRSKSNPRLALIFGFCDGKAQDQTLGPIRLLNFGVSSLRRLSKLNIKDSVSLVFVKRKWYA